jgi:hypothetical protein
MEYVALDVHKNYTLDVHKNYTWAREENPKGERLYESRLAHVHGTIKNFVEGFSRCNRDLEFFNVANTVLSIFRRMEIHAHKHHSNHELLLSHGWHTPLAIDSETRHRGFHCDVHLKFFK